ncbi:unnamed protein product, partial [Amoebophrya sp. A25]
KGSADHGYGDLKDEDDAVVAAKNTAVYHASRAKSLVSVHAGLETAFPLAKHVVLDRRNAFWQVHLDEEERLARKKARSVQNASKDGVSPPSGKVGDNVDDDDLSEPHNVDDEVDVKDDDPGAGEWTALFARIAKEESDRLQAEEHDEAERKREREERAAKRREALQKLADEEAANELAQAADKVVELQRQKKLDRQREQEEERARIAVEETSIGEAANSTTVGGPGGTRTGTAPAGAAGLSAASTTASHEGNTKSAFFTPAFDAVGVVDTESPKKADVVDTSQARSSESNDASAGGTGMRLVETEERPPDTVFVVANPNRNTANPKSGDGEAVHRKDVLPGQKLVIIHEDTSTPEERMLKRGEQLSNAANGAKSPLSSDHQGNAKGDEAATETTGEQNVEPSENDSDGPYEASMPVGVQPGVVHVQHVNVKLNSPMPKRASDKSPNGASDKSPTGDLETTVDGTTDAAAGTGNKDEDGEANEPMSESASLYAQARRLLEKAKQTNREPRIHGHGGQHGGHGTGTGGASTGASTGGASTSFSGTTLSSASSSTSGPGQQTKNSSTLTQMKDKIGGLFGPLLAGGNVSQQGQSAAGGALQTLLQQDPDAAAAAIEKRLGELVVDPKVSSSSITTAPFSQQGKNANSINGGTSTSDSRGG